VSAYWIFSWQSTGSVRAQGLNVSRLNKSSRGVILCYVTDRQGLAGVEPAGSYETLVHKIEAAAKSGVDWIQIREKDLSGKDCAWVTREAIQCAASSASGKTVQPHILVNDRLDVALSESAGGLHLGEHGLPLAEAKRLISAHAAKSDFLVGVSCHSLEAAQSAAAGGADYLFFGPVFATPSKASYGPPQGFERLSEVCRAVPIPVLAIGGITLANAAYCLSAGASGIAAIRLFQDASDISSIVQSLKALAR
jgi:thiamine-phosphate pyrophosphorylase